MKNEREASYMQKYAELVISLGINLYPGQSLMIKTGPAAYWFAQILAKQAYAQKASYVQIEVDDNQVTKARLDASHISDPITFPDYKSGQLQEMLQKDWAYIRIEETADQRALENTDIEILKAYTAAAHKLSREFKNSMMNSEHSWCVICAPSKPWAKQVIGSKGTYSQLVDLLIPILRLNADDPKKAWEEHGERLLSRSRKLNELQLESLHITDEGTDLTIGLTPHARWVGGPDHLPDGRRFFANMPTEEVFSVPDYTRTEGTVKLTMPVSIMDSIVEGVTLHFREGKVTSYHAETNQHILEKFFSLDEGTRYLGEIALVDTSSPIFRTGTLFHSVLFDENASCHIALGQGYSGCLDADPPAYTEEEKRKYRCNISMAHSDVMFGSQHTTITGRSRNGQHVEIMREGKLLV